MIFGRRKATVATPSGDVPTPNGNSVSTGDTSETVPAIERLRLHAAGDVAQLTRDVQTLADELLWQRERFDKLQNRVTSELREIRREVDRFYEPEEEEEE
jgi:hypothetical protein